MIVKMLRCALLFRFFIGGLLSDIQNKNPLRNAKKAPYTAMYKMLFVKKTTYFFGAREEEMLCRA
jgi:hypothetical protein